MERIVYINGEYIAAADAKVSIFDRGFLFADSVYEVLPVYEGKAYFIDMHLARLKSSLASARIDMPEMNWLTLFQELISRNGGGDLQLYLQITRGNEGVRKHDIAKNLKPTVVAFTIHTPYPTTEEKRSGLKASLVEDIRWERCDIKTTSLLANILLNDEAVSKGANTALLIRGGYLTEGSSSNVFMVDAEGIIKTPPKNNFCLPGITRQITVELISSLKWPLQEEKISRDALFKAKEIWVTSTTKEIYPVTCLDNVAIDNGVAGKYWEQINEQYRQLIKKLYEK